MLKVIQISDSHISSTLETRNNVQPKITLKRAIEHIKENHSDAKLVVHTGDLVGPDKEEADYQEYKEIIDTLDIPIKHIAGNQDTNRRLLRSVVLDEKPVDTFIHFTKDIDEWRFIGIDSSEGRVDENELKYLDEKLSEVEEKFAIIFTHYHILPARIRWLDTEPSIENPLDVINTIAKHHNVRVVSNGHVHMETSAYFIKKHFYSTPSLSWQFSTENADELTIADEDLPGYRVFELGQTGGLKSFVERLK